jgi:hypothetical protein
MTTTEIVDAVRQAMSDEDRFDIGPSVRLRACQILRCDPWQLDAALTDDVINDVYGY